MFHCCYHHSHSPLTVGVRTLVWVNIEAWYDSVANFMNFKRRLVNISRSALCQCEIGE